MEARSVQPMLRIDKHPAAVKRMIRRAIVIALVAHALSDVGLIGSAVAQQLPNASNQNIDMMKIRIDIDGRTITATLDENPTAREFAALLPLTLTLTDYGSTEKIADLPRKLTTNRAPVGFEPTIGTIAYYAPWGNLALFRKNFRYSEGLIRLGYIESGGETLNETGALRVVITAVDR